MQLEDHTRRVEEFGWHLLTAMHDALRRHAHALDRLLLTEVEANMDGAPRQGTTTAAEKKQSNSNTLQSSSSLLVAPSSLPSPHRQQLMEQRRQLDEQNEQGALRDVLAESTKPMLMFPPILPRSSRVGDSTVMPVSVSTSAKTVTTNSQQQPQSQSQHEQRSQQQGENVETQRMSSFSAPIFVSSDNKRQPQTQQQQQQQHQKVSPKQQSSSKVNNNNTAFQLPSRKQLRELKILAFALRESTTTLSSRVNREKQLALHRTTTTAARSVMRDTRLVDDMLLVASARNVLAHLEGNISAFRQKRRRARLVAASMPQDLLDELGLVVGRVHKSLHLHDHHRDVDDSNGKYRDDLEQEQESSSSRHVEPVAAGSVMVAEQQEQQQGQQHGESKHNVDDVNIPHEEQNVTANEATTFTAVAENQVDGGDEHRVIHSLNNDVDDSEQNNETAANHSNSTSRKGKRVRNKKKKRAHFAEKLVTSEHQQDEPLLDASVVAADADGREGEQPQQQQVHDDNTVVPVNRISVAELLARARATLSENQRLLEHSDNDDSDDGADNHQDHEGHVKPEPDHAGAAAAESASKEQHSAGSAAEPKEQSQQQQQASSTTSNTARRKSSNPMVVGSVGLRESSETGKPQRAKDFAKPRNFNHSRSSISNASGQQQQQQISLVPENDVERIKHSQSLKRLPSAILRYGATERDADLNTITKSTKSLAAAVANARAEIDALTSAGAAGAGGVSSSDVALVGQLLRESDELMGSMKPVTTLLSEEQRMRRAFVQQVRASAVHEINDLTSDLVTKQREVLRAKEQRRELIREYLIWRQTRRADAAMAADTFEAHVASATRTNDVATQCSVPKEAIPVQLIKTVRLMQEIPNLQRHVAEVRKLVVELTSVDVKSAEALRCQACEAVLSDPVLIWPCGDTVCARCARNSLREFSDQPFKKCPACRMISLSDSFSVTQNVLVQDVVAKWFFKQSGFCDVAAASDVLQQRLQRFTREEVLRTFKAVQEAVQESEEEQHQQQQQLLAEQEQEELEGTTTSY